MKPAIVLFAHGSRDPEWARPFESIAARLSKDFAVRVAYLEHAKPDLGEAIAQLAAAGGRPVRVVPLFLGAGGHVKNDLPRLIAGAAARHPGIELALEPPIGEQPEIIEAIARAIAKFALQ